MTPITHSPAETEGAPAVGIGASVDPSPEVNQPDTQDTPVVLAVPPSVPKKRAPSLTRVRKAVPSNIVSDAKIAPKSTRAKAKVAVTSETPVSPAAKRKTASRTPVKTALKPVKSNVAAVKKVKVPAKKVVEKASVKLDVDEKTKRPKKEKVVRDGFTMPKSDYDLISVLKSKCMAKGVAIKKGELLRAGLRLLNAASNASLLAAVKSLETVKTGRPRKT